MELSYYLVDVFTERAFNGAQIAVFPKADALSGEQMQILARELGLSDTVFITGTEQSTDVLAIKVFSPLARQAFGGQATIAAAYVLGKLSLVSLQEPCTRLTLHQDAGPVNVVISPRGDDDLFIQFSRKAQAVVDRYVPSNKDLAAALSLPEREVISRPYTPMLVSCEQPYLVIPLRTFDAVRRAVFDVRAWTDAVASVSPTEQLLLFSGKSDLPGSNFHARLVGPTIGPDEDPPIGSAIPAFTGYLGTQEHIRQGTYAFVVDRGTLTTRKSELTVELVNRTGQENEIRLGGPAVLVAQGSIAIP